MGVNPCVVTEPCVKCKYTDCVTVCPTDAFREDAEMVVIEPDECIDCGACVPVCPVQAIFAKSDVPRKWEPYIALNAERSRFLPLINEKKDPLAGKGG